MSGGLIDLHTHTTCSDGALTPTELARRAVAKGVTTLAVTDHDTVAAWSELASFKHADLACVCGIELSSHWGPLDVHVVGLNVDPSNVTLLAGIASQRDARDTRARRIAHKLKRRRIPDPLAGAMRYAQGAVIGRPHFAQHLVACGAVPDVAAAFKRYLGKGKPAAVRTDWPALQTVITWIHAAGGKAVLAHPLKYRVTSSRRRQLIKAFRDAGGDAMEVISGVQRPDATSHASRLCTEFGLLASLGSDFHRPSQSWNDLGHGLVLPGGLRPVWAEWAEWAA
ncbi:MAG: PHP domain-containing protein [Pseudomonadota bacterium]